MSRWPSFAVGCYGGWSTQPFILLLPLVDVSLPVYQGWLVVLVLLESTEEYKTGSTVLRLTWIQHVHHAPFLVASRRVNCYLLGVDQLSLSSLINGGASDRQHSAESSTDMTHSTLTFLCCSSAGQLSTQVRLAVVVLLESTEEHERGRLLLKVSSIQSVHRSTRGLLCVSDVLKYGSRLRRWWSLHVV